MTKKDLYTKTPQVPANKIAGKNPIGSVSIGSGQTTPALAPQQVRPASSFGRPDYRIKPSTKAHRIGKR